MGCPRRSAIDPGLPHPLSRWNAWGSVAPHAGLKPRSALALTRGVYTSRIRRQAGRARQCEFPPSRWSKCSARLVQRPSAIRYRA